MANDFLTSARLLRNLYFVRTAFQIVWAAGVLATALTQPNVAAVLLIAYPLWDVACTLWDLKTSNFDASARTSQAINAVLAKPEVVKQMGDIGVQVLQTTPQQFARVLVHDEKKYDKLIRDLGVTVDDQ